MHQEDKRDNDSCKFWPSLKTKQAVTWLKTPPINYGVPNYTFCSYENLTESSFQGFGTTATHLHNFMHQNLKNRGTSRLKLAIWILWVVI